MTPAGSTTPGLGSAQTSRLNNAGTSASPRWGSASHGYFPPGSVLRKVHRERAVGLMYGQRALAIGAIDPRNFVGTRTHTRHAARPFHRLAATGKMFEEIFFGTKAEADRVLAAVHRMHSTVKGELPADAGSMPAGTPYSALDPELMLWTIAPAADSAIYFYELFVRELPDAERDEFWAEYVRFGELFGMSASVAPTSWQGLREYVDGKINGPDAHLTDEARYVGHAVMMRIPHARSRALPMRVHNVLMNGSLPPRIRELYGLRWTTSDAIAFRAAVAASRAARPLTPRSALRGRCTTFFDDVAAAERARIESGRSAPGALAPVA
jgi:uncharacterized protein (DUF2236 family)